MTKGKCIKCKRNNKKLVSQYKTIKNKKKYIGGKCKNCSKSKNITRKSLKKRTVRKFKGGFYEKPTTGEATPVTTSETNDAQPITPSELTTGEMPTEELTLEQKWGELRGDNIDDAGDVVYGADSSVDFYGGDIEGQTNKLQNPDDPSGQLTPQDQASPSDETNPPPNDEIQTGGKGFKKHYMYTKKGKRYIAKTRKQHLKGVKLGHKHKKPKKSRKKRR